MRVAYLLESFPNTSETFILNEIVEAIDQGIDVKVFAQLRPQASCPHARISRLDERVEYLESLDSPDLSRTLVLHARLAVTSPLRYLKTLAYACLHREAAMLWAFKVCVYYLGPVRRFAPHRIHTHFAYGNSRFAMLVAMLLDVPYTFTIHGWYDLYKAPPPFLAQVIAHSQATFTVCSFNRDYILSTFAVPERRVSVLRCGIPIDAPSSDGGPTIDRLILSVGRLHYHKAYHVLVKACHILTERGVKHACWIIGGGELRGSLQALIDELGLTETVQLLGEKSNEDVRALLPRAQVFALTSEVEVVGLVNAEAMASQVPVVATSVFGVPELVEHGVTGYLCPPNDPAAIADSLQFLLEHPEVCRKMGLMGRQKVLREHDLRAQVTKLVSVWMEGGRV